MEKSILERFPYAAFKGFERVQVETIVKRIAAAHEQCVRDGEYGDDEEQLIDDIFDILKPSEDDELLILRAVDVYLSLI